MIVTTVAQEIALACERRIAYGVALEGLGVAFDPDASALTLLLLVQQETARARELGEAVRAYLDSTDSYGQGPEFARLWELCPPTPPGPSPEIVALAEELIAKVAAMDAEKEQR